MLCLVATSLFDFVQAQEAPGYAGVFLRMGAGARASAVGGAYTGIAEGPSAGYWNPAGLAFTWRPQFEFTWSQRPLDQAAHFVSGAWPVAHRISLAASWLGFRVRDLEARTSKTEAPDYTFGHASDALFITVSSAVTSWLALGANVKLLRNTLDNFTATGTGLDVGLLFKPSRRLRFGVMIQDASSHLRWPENYSEAIPISLRLGGAVEPVHNLLLSVDVHRTTGDEPRWRAGAEWRPLYALPLRVGFGDRVWTGGLGLEFAVSDHGLQLNYAVNNEPRVNDIIHRLSVVFTLNQHATRLPGDTTTPPYSRKSRASKRPDRARVTVRVLNVRSGPGTGYRVIAQIHLGEVYPLLETSGKWHKLRLHDGRTGWAHGGYLELVNRR